MSNSAHAPTRLSTYQAVHQNCMQSVRKGGFVHHDTLRFEVLPNEFVLSGEIACLGQIVIQVEKHLAIIGGDYDDPLVQTIQYRYNASVRGWDTFLRNDNSHPYPGHPDDHHRHVEDLWTGEKLVEWVGEARWPTLTDFVNDVQDWYYAHRDKLPDPEALPILGLWAPMFAHE